MVKIIAIVITIVVILNFISREPDCSYSNYSGSFTFTEMNFKERNFRNCKAKFNLFKKEYNRDTVLYRLCEKKFWQFWNFKEYLFSEKYQLPYANWNNIQRRRGRLDHTTGFQDF